MPRIVSQLAARLELLSSSLLDLIVVGPHRPVSQFRREPLVNGLYVVHAPHGAILLSGLMLDTDDDALQGTRADRIDALGAGGFATTYRVVDLGTADLARQLGRIVFDLFGGAFPLSQDAPALPATDVEKAAAASEIGESAPTFRKRGRPRKAETQAAAPQKEVEAETSGSVTDSQQSAPAPKKRGRPPKIMTALPSEDIPVADVADVDPGPAPVGDVSATEQGAGGTRATHSSSATLDVAKRGAGTTRQEIASDEENDADDSSEPDGGGRPGEPVLIMTKNQRREKRRRELAQIRGTEP